MRKEELEKYYLQFNRLFFFDKLPDLSHISISIENKNDSDYLGYSEIDREKSDIKREDIYYNICINEGHDISDKEIRSVLCHEMIHIWQWNDIDFEKYDSDYSWKNGHNSAFISKMNSINYLAKEEGMDIKIELFSIE